MNNTNNINVNNNNINNNYFSNKINYRNNIEEPRSILGELNYLYNNNQ